MLSLAAPFLKRISLTSTHATTLRRLGEYRGRQELFTRQRPEVLETLRTAAMIESTESSNRLEGITAPRRRLEKLVLGSTRPDSRSEQEIAGYRDALQLIHESADAMDVTPNLILQLHARVYRYLPTEGGRWKATDNRIVERTSDGDVVRIRFTPVSAVATPQAMTDLVTGWTAGVEEQRYDALLLIPLFILDFLCVHPFTDGNGRLARLLTVLLLYQQGYSVGRYISLERLFEESRQSYYETLEASSQGWHDSHHDVMPWVEYTWGVLLAAYEEFESRVSIIGTGKGSKSEHVRAAVVRRMTPFRISELERDCPGVSRELVRRVLRQLRDEGRVSLEGRGQGARWKYLGD